MRQERLGLTARARNLVAHLRALKIIGEEAAEAVTERLESLGLDLDTPADLTALTAAVAERPDRAPQTAAALHRLGSPA